MERVPVGGTDLEVTTLTFGSAPLASVFWGNDERTAVATVQAARDEGIRLFDTAPFYGLGEAEERVGVGLSGAEVGDALVATKVGRTVTGSGPEREVVFDYSPDGVRRQLDASRQRLGRDRLDIVHVHDPEEHLDEAIGSCLPTLSALRAAGEIGAVSVGTNHCSTVLRFLDDGDPDLVMLAGRLTLLDRSALVEVVPACARRGVPLFAAGVFNSGVLADPSPGRWFDYAPADEAVLARARTMQRICAEAGVPLRAVAMAFPLRFEPVATVVVGMSGPGEVTENLALMELEIPDDLWAELGVE
ncbi:MAG: aldo/keto reductase [Actinomycetota bacterium]